MLKYASDCSGIEAPIQALINLNIEFEHIFSSDIDKFVKKSLLANYNPQIFYDDIYQEKQKCDLDLYFAGFPCTNFSYAGKREGINNPRGLIFERSIEIIKETNTNVFILENVPGIMTIHNGETFKLLLQKLNNLGIYNVYHKLLNTKDYGIPQNRNRIYIIGIKKELNINFEWPKKKEMKNLNDIIDYSDTSNSKIPINNQEILDRIKTSEATFLNLGFWNFKDHSYKDYCPTLTSSSPYYNLKMKRRMNIKEMLRIQGFSEDFKIVCSYTQIKKQLGNSMSVNVLEEILKCIFLAN